MESMEIKKPTKKQLDKFDLEEYRDILKGNEHENYFYASNGEHYKLLAYIASKFKKGSTLIDCGTYKGLSALALATNKNVNVITYDISDRYILPGVTEKKNIIFKPISCLEDIETIAKSDFIFLDIDPHDGVKEPQFVALLKEHNYKGLVLCDDINLNSRMSNWWNSIQNKKENWTSVGHHSGTGIIYLK